ncbi:MAG: polysaccharide biosynthesis/export family protein [Flavobacterium psychrophilum]
MKKIVLLVFSLILLLSCASKKKVVYLQDIDQTKSYDSSTLYEPKLQPDDLLSIIVSAENPELSVPFNLPQIQGNYEINNNQNGIKTYLVDNFGFIEFPVIGKLKLGGLTRTEATAKLVTAVGEYIKNPIINLRILNFKVSILGEVLKPSSFTLSSERITLLEAISMAGDLTIYGKRNNILIIREAEGKKTYNRVDITKSDFLNSPFYYLAQNDIVVVEPNKTRVNASVVGPNVTATISAISVLVTLIVVLLR